MIKLYGFGATFNLPDPSPFVTKVELAMRVAGIEHQRIDTSQNLQKAPKAKLPFIEDDGKIISDSVFIHDHLRQHHDFDVDKWLTAEQKAMAQLIGKSLDENLYWVIVHSRWIKDDVWPIINKQFFAPLPFPLNKIISKIARSSTRKQINGHGMGKHSDEEIVKIAHATWNSLSVLLADKPYFFGDKISSLDIGAFAMLSGFTLSNLPAPINKEIEQYSNLVEFTKRIATDHYKDSISLSACP